MERSSRFHRERYFAKTKFAALVRGNYYRIVRQRVARVLVNYLSLEREQDDANKWTRPNSMVLGGRNDKTRIKGNDKNNKNIKYFGALRNRQRNFYIKIIHNCILIPPRSTAASYCFTGARIEHS